MGIAEKKERRAFYDAGIRLATISDGDAVLALAEYLGYKARDLAMATGEYRRILNSDSDWLFVFTSELSLTGWIHLFQANRIASSSFIEIGGLVVHPDFRRQGIGRQLVQHAGDFAVKRKMALRVRSNIKREETRQFYLNSGFSIRKSQNMFQIDYE